MQPSKPDIQDWSESEKVRVWRQALIEGGCSLDGLELIAKLDKRDGTLLFALAKAKAFDPDGHPLLPYVLFRGAAVVVVPRILPEEGGAPLYLTVSQRRSGHGRLSLEFPAGMLDGESDSRKVGAKELGEETGWEISADKLVPLWVQPLYSSPGLSDESIHFFGVSETWSVEKRQSFEGTLSGVAQEDERIRVALKSEFEIRAEADSLQTLLGLELFLKNTQFS
jgi:8-oxo-dGTP pyrophosphatase MutT (NUDIX family)